MLKNRMANMVKILLPIGVLLYLLLSYLGKGYLDITDLISVAVSVCITLFLFLVIKLIMR